MGSVGGIGDGEDIGIIAGKIFKVKASVVADGSRLMHNRIVFDCEGDRSDIKSVPI